LDEDPIGNTNFFLNFCNVQNLVALTPFLFFAGAAQKDKERVWKDLFG
jgi:hypothetical protein